MSGNTGWRERASQGKQPKAEELGVLKDIDWAYIKRVYKNASDQN